MAINIHTCWNCGADTTAQKRMQYIFWCNKKCHDVYDRKVDEKSRDMLAWSNYMCGEGQVPESMKHLVMEVKKIPSKPSSGKKPTKRQNNKKKRVCGTCGKAGHNTRTCGRPKPEPVENEENTEITIGKKKERLPKGTKVTVRKRNSRAFWLHPPKKQKRKTKKKSARSRRKQYTCGKCGCAGHNARS